MLLTRREAIAGTGLALLTGQPVLAQPAYPSRTIKLIVPYPAGGTTDFLGRLVADQLKNGLGATAIVENKPGAATSLGADAIQVFMPPDGSDESYYEHFRAIAGSTPRAIAIHGQPSMALLRMLKPIENIVAFKEEFSPEYTLQIYEEFGDRWNIFAGGSKSRLLTYLPYGMHAYYSAFSTFAPQVAMNFWHAVERKDLAAAGEQMTRYLADQRALDSPEAEPRDTKAR